MADTKVKAIIDAIAALLDATGKPAGLIVKKERTYAIPSDANLKRINVYPAADESKQDNASRSRSFPGVHRGVTMSIDCIIAGTDADNETLRAWTITQIMKDPSLNGVVVDSIEGKTEWFGESDSKANYSIASMEIFFEYTRAKNSL